MWAGCGRKGAPQPPQQSVPARVNDLSYRINNDKVELRWTVTAADHPGASDPAAVKLYRFKQSAEESDCKKCPIRFTEIADLPVQKKRFEKSRSSTMSFTDALEQGYRYIYKVIVYSQDGVAGRDSNTVEFSF